MRMPSQLRARAAFTRSPRRCIMRGGVETKAETGVFVTPVGQSPWLWECGSSEASAACASVFGRLGVRGWGLARALRCRCRAATGRPSSRAPRCGERRRRRCAQVHPRGQQRAAAAALPAVPQPLPLGLPVQLVHHLQQEQLPHLPDAVGDCCHLALPVHGLHGRESAEPLEVGCSLELVWDCFSP